MLGDGKPHQDMGTLREGTQGPAPPALLRMLRREAAALGWESPGSPLQTGCSCASRDPAAGTSPGLQGRAQSSHLSPLSAGRHLPLHWLPGLVLSCKRVLAVWRAVVSCSW